MKQFIQKAVRILTVAVAAAGLPLAAYGAWFQTENFKWVPLYHCVLCAAAALTGAYFMMQYLEEGDGKKAYNSCLPYKLEYDSDYLLMDIAYAFYPEELTAGCEESLLEAAFKSDSKSLYNAEMKGEAFAQRFHINLKNLKKVYARGQWLYNKEHPSSKSSGSSGKKKSKSRKSYSYGSHSSSNSSSRPEDRDIGSYYEDNRDEYDDYDDACEGFLDDEGAWDDY